MTTAADTFGPDVDTKDVFKDYLTDPGIAIEEVANPVYDLFRDHFGDDPLKLPTTSQAYLPFLAICYQRALDEFLNEPGRSHDLRGVICPSVRRWWMADVTLGHLLSPPTFAFVPPVFTPPDCVLVESGWQKKEVCVLQGVVLFADEEGPGAFWIHTSPGREIVLEIMTTTVERGRAIMARLRDAIVRLSPFPGQILEVEDVFGYPMIRFLERPDPVAADEVILPEGLLRQIERHSLGVLRSQAALTNSGRHLKRGLLLHGRPGTGKTHTIKYLIGHLPHATIAVMTGGRMPDIHILRDIIDLLVPAVVILDDVDLIAEDRALSGARSALFELLDILDGVAEDRDLLFLLTTNRPNELEPAVAARPGRIDQAIEVPRPDADCRRRLVDLYARGLQLTATDDEVDAFVERTDGASASFIREALRRASVASLREDPSPASIEVSGRHLQRALDDLLDPDNPLTPLLLGALPKHALPTAVRPA